MSDEMLPPFGVRGLRSPGKPFSVVELTETQYDASIRSYPTSALTWHDEDDGETVTVGSGWELKERLKDPIPPTNPCIKYHDRWNGQGTDRYIHLFDISNSNTSLDVWREHEAYFSKTQALAKNVSTATSQSEQKQPTQDLSSESGVIDSQTNSSKQKSTVKFEDQLDGDNRQTQDSTTVVDLAAPTVPALIDGFGVQLDHFAGFLRGTSDTLRKVAEKARETDTSPIEDVLSGMTTILGEVGAFGLDVMDKLSDSGNVSEPIPHPKSQPEATSATDSDDEDVFDKKTFAYLQELARSTGSFDPGTESSEQEISKACQHLMMDQNLLRGVSNVKLMAARFSEHGKPLRKEYLRLERCLLIHLLSLNVWESVNMPSTNMAHLGVQARDQHRGMMAQVLSKMHSGARQEDVSAFPTFPTFPIFPSMANHPPAETSNSVATPTRQAAILDQDSDAIDAAFSARYPPLMSLRKARTFDVLRPDQSTASDSPRSRLLRTVSTRQPRPQVFDAETLRRSDYAKACFPGQEYTPGPEPTSRMPFRLKSTATVSANEIDPTSDDQSDTASIRTRDSANEISVSPINDAEQKSFNAAPYVHIVSPIAEVEAESVAPSSLAPPGAWPDTTHTNLLPSNTHSTEHEQRNYHKTADIDQTNKANDIYSSMSHRGSHRRLHRHRSLIDTASHANPQNGLHRSQTVTAANPAARLNGPFSPLFPPPVTPSFLTEQEPQLPKVTAGPIRNLHRSVSDRRPRSLYEPYRSVNAHRTFEPVWEGQAASLKQAEPNPGVVIVDASNFEPGTSEQDVRDLLADDCRTVIGINTLISCRIVATEPEVVAKLVIKDKTNADKVIDKYNKRWLDGRPLKFEYAKTGIDARINRIRGAFPAPSPRHLRSVPDLRRANTSKPSFRDFTSQARPIVKPQSAAAAAKEQSLPPTPLPSQPISPPAFAPNLISECEKQLRDMGYGLYDPAMLSRLHVYACAANGDIHEAIEMVEEDIKANKVGIVRERYVRPTVEDGEAEDKDDRDDSDAYNEELEQAIKLSMEQK